MHLAGPDPGPPRVHPGAGEPNASSMTQVRAPKKTMSRTEVARLFQVSASTVTRWAREGKIPAQRTLGGHYRFSTETIRKLAGEMAGGSFEIDQD
jgi:excisionase family DNA binding protein